MNDNRTRQRDIDRDYTSILNEVTGLPVTLKCAKDNIKLVQFKNEIASKQVSYEMIIRMNISFEKKMEMINIKAELNDLADECGTRHKFLKCYMDLWNHYSECLKKEIHNNNSPSLKPTYKLLDYDVHNPIDEYLRRLDMINLDFSKKTIIYGKIMQLSTCNHDEESHNMRIWLDYVTTYPWTCTSNSTLNNNMSMTVLQKEIEDLKLNVNREIYGMDKPKEEMLRYYLDFKMGHKSTYTIALCGPPGVGKTIFFQVFAKHIKIPFKLIQGGCITDVGYIQGGLKMYIGAGAGCITDAIHESKQEDLMIIFDELEKIYDNVNPMAIMNQINHVIDISSNHTFVDHYIGSNLPVNYSRGLFGATMNDKTKLTDVTDNRLLIFDLQGYTLEEKINIAKNYVLPKMIKDSIFKDNNNLVFSDDIIKYIIDKKVEHEPGIRKLEHTFKQIISKMQYSHIINNDKKLGINKSAIDAFLNN